MDITCIFFGVLFVVFGLLFAIGKIHERIPAWKDTPDEEKKKINIVPLCRNIGEVIMLCGVIFLLRGFVAGFGGTWFVIAMIAWMALVVFDVVMISKGKRYKRQ